MLFFSQGFFLHLSVLPILKTYEWATNYLSTLSLGWPYLFIWIIKCWWLVIKQIYFMKIVEEMVQQAKIDYRQRKTRSKENPHLLKWVLYLKPGSVLSGFETSCKIFMWCLHVFYFVTICFFSLQNNIYPSGKEVIPEILDHENYFLNIILLRI